MLIPEPPALSLAVFKSLTSVQLVPFQDSVAPVIGDVPPTTKPDVDIPIPLA